METVEEIEQYAIEQGYEGVTVILRNPDFADAFIGLSQDGQAIYDYNLMVQSLMKTEGMSEEEAVEFIDYNTVRAIPYMEGEKPIILYPILE